MPPRKRAEKAPEITTRYEVCRTDGTDSRYFPDGSTLTDATNGCDLLNGQVARGRTNPSLHHPHGQELHSPSISAPTLSHEGVPVKYEVRIHNSDEPGPYIVVGGAR